MRALQQHSKRSSSNFSNGSSSCGRVTGAHTGGRLPSNAMQMTNNGGSQSGNVPPFSPLLNPANNNTVLTPNNQKTNQNVTQRLEDFEQLYDEILDEEEEHERKLLRLQRRKQRKLDPSMPNPDDDSNGDDEDFEESMYLYEDEELEDEYHN